MSRPQVHIRLEQFILDAIDVRAGLDGLQGRNRGVSRGRPEWIRRLIYRELGFSLPVSHGFEEPCDPEVTATSLGRLIEHFRGTGAKWVEIPGLVEHATGLELSDRACRARHRRWQNVKAKLEAEKQERRKAKEAAREEAERRREAEQQRLKQLEDRLAKIEGEQQYAIS